MAGAHWKGIIRIKRLYEPPEPKEGKRCLMERLWPRGVKREALALGVGFKEGAPSDALRRWFGHDPIKWEEFQRRYFAELEAHPEAIGCTPSTCSRSGSTSWPPSPGWAG